LKLNDGKDDLAQDIMKLSRANGERNGVATACGLQQRKRPSVPNRKRTRSKQRKLSPEAQRAQGVREMLRGMKRDTCITMNFGPQYNFWWTGKFVQITTDSKYVLQQQRSEPEQTKVPSGHYIFRFIDEHNEVEEEFFGEEILVEHYENATERTGWFKGTLVLCILFLPTPTPVVTNE
jgi:hypothetical protein